MADYVIVISSFHLFDCKTRIHTSNAIRFSYVMNYLMLSRYYNDILLELSYCVQNTSTLTSWYIFSDFTQHYKFFIIILYIYSIYQIKSKYLYRSLELYLRYDISYHYLLSIYYYFLNNILEKWDKLFDLESLDYLLTYKSFYCFNFRK